MSDGISNDIRRAGVTGVAPSHSGGFRVRNASILASAVTLCLMMSACGEGNSSAGAEGANEAHKIAYLTASSANTWLSESGKTIEQVASENNAEVTEFDAQFKPADQTKQIQDVIASGQYDGIIVVAVDGAAVIPDIELAVEEGIEVVVMNQIVGDKLDTAEPQVDGVAASVLAPPEANGERLGELTKRACADLDPCNVVYFYGIKGLPADTAFRDGFDRSTASDSNITVVAEPEGKFLGAEESLKAMQDVLQRGIDVDVVVGADQSIQGTLLALSDAKHAGDVKLIGYGGSKPAIEGIKNGTWFGDVFAAPRTEAELATKALFQAMEDGTDAGGTDATATFPDNGLVTAENVSKFEAQWAG